MPEVNLDRLVVVNLITNPRAATAADLKTVLTLDPEWTVPGVSEFRSLRQFDDAHPSAGVMTRARIAAALNQDRVASVKIAGVGGGGPGGHIVKFTPEDPDVLVGRERYMHFTAIEPGQRVAFTIGVGLDPIEYDFIAADLVDVDSLTAAANEIGDQFVDIMGPDVSARYTVQAVSIDPGDSTGRFTIVLTTGGVAVQEWGGAATWEYTAEPSQTVLVSEASGSPHQFPTPNCFLRFSIDGVNTAPVNFDNKRAFRRIVDDAVGEIGSLGYTVTPFPGQQHMMEGFMIVGATTVADTSDLLSPGVGFRGFPIVTITEAPAQTISERIEEIRSIDDGWIALHLLASIDATETDPEYIPHADVGAVAELFEVQREKFLVVDAIDTETPTGNPSTSALKTAVGRGEFAAVFLDGPNPTAVPAQNPSRYLHGIATTAKVLAMDPDRRSAAFSWQKLNFCDPSYFAPEFFPANEGWANFYGVNRGLALTAKGVNTAGNPAHGTVSALWFKYRVGERITSNMAEYSDRYGKIPFDKNGIGIVAAAVDRVLWDAENNGHAVAGSGRYNAPAVEDVPALDYAAGHYAMQAGFRILGSIVSVELDGVVTLAFTGSDIGITE